jgi:hypothetical protein
MVVMGWDEGGLRSGDSWIVQCWALESADLKNRIFGDLDFVGCGYAS